MAFTKAAWMHGIGVLLGTLIRFGVLSAILSLTLYMVAWSAIQVQIHTGGYPQFVTDEPLDLYPQVGNDYVQNITAKNVTILGIFEEFNPDTYLTQFPIFKTLEYVKWLWYALLIPVFLGGAIYFIILAQGQGIEQQILDYIGDVAWPTIMKIGLGIMGWLLIGGITLIGPMMYPGTLFSDGLMGLQMLHALDALVLIQKFIVTGFPFAPVAAEVGAILYLIKEVHAGWIGNQW